MTQVKVKIEEIKIYSLSDNSFHYILEETYHRGDMIEVIEPRLSRWLESGIVSLNLIDDIQKKGKKMKPNINCKKESVNIVHMLDIEQFIEEATKLRYNIAEVEQSMNDSWVMVNLSKPKKNYDKSKFNETLKGLVKQEEDLSEVLQELCNFGLIPHGKTFINISW